MSLAAGRMAPEGFGWELAAWNCEYGRSVVLIVLSSLVPVRERNQVPAFIEVVWWPGQMSLAGFNSRVGPPKGGASRPADLSGDVVDWWFLHRTCPVK